MSTSRNPQSPQSSHSPSPMTAAVLGAPRPIVGGSGPRRPKLSLQTAVQTPPAAQKVTLSAGPGPMTIDSPTSRNTTANAKTGLSIGRPVLERSKSANASSTASSPLSSAPSPNSAKSIPYALLQGTRPILRNSPLRGIVSSSSSGSSSNLLNAANKRVMFRDALVELMPTPSIEGSGSESEADTGEETEGTNANDNDPSQHPTPISRRKKQREWVWTIGNDSPAEGKFLRGSDHKPIYPRTPRPGDNGSSSDTEDDRTPSRVPLTPGTPSSAKDAKSPSQVPLPITPETPAAATPRTPSQVPLPDTPIIALPQRRRPRQHKQ